MTEAEIMKALAYCKNQGLTSECTECSYKGSKRDCMGVMLEDALDLINRKNAENEQLYKTLDYRTEKIRELESENKRLQKAIQVQEIMLGNQDSAIKKARAEAIKEFAERVKAEIGKSFNLYWQAKEVKTILQIITNIAKEMGCGE